MSARSISREDDIVSFLRKRDYRMVRELGSGACGRTVLLHDDEIDEQFVCKKYSPWDESVRSDLFKNFIREIKLLHRVHHPNVVRVFNYYLYPENFTGYILMEFIDGLAIDTFLAQNPEKANDVFHQVINGFAYLESSGILHRDIRPDNVMVTDSGLVKIIDLGFGKQIVQSDDFDKSVSLNWWCEPPMDFDDSRYDFSTEVYFVGKLFEKIIREHNISHFHYTEQLRQMCLRDPQNRVQEFSIVLHQVLNDQFTQIDFSYGDKQSYRSFADELCQHITKIETNTKYIEDIPRIERELENAYQKVMLEASMPDCVILIRCFLDGMYYYHKRDFPVHIVRGFLDVLRGCTPERSKILLANLQTRLDAIPRYSQPIPGYEDNIPF